MKKTVPFFFDNVRAIIWDMDGVLSDTQKIHAKVESLLLNKYGIFMSPSEITIHYAGVSDEEMFLEIFEQHKIKVTDIHELVAQKWSLMKEVTEGKITAIPHAIDLLKEFKKNQFHLAIASASPLEFIQYVVDSLKIRGHFSALVSSEEVKKGKPEPDVFLLAADKLGVLPGQCIVIEDGTNGMIGARKAGMRSIGLVGNNATTVPADMIVTSLSQVKNMFYKKGTYDTRKFKK